MQYSHWTFASLIFLIVNEYHSLLQAKRLTFQRNSCIDLVAEHHFHSNSTVAVLISGFFDLQKIAVFNLQVAVQDDDLIQILSLRTNFSLVILRPDDDDCNSSGRFYGHKAPDYFIFVGSADLVVSGMKRFCFDKLTDDFSMREGPPFSHDFSHFVVYLET